MEVLSGLEPRELFRCFEMICSVPHGSGNTRAVSDIIEGLAWERGLEYRRDALGNVVVFSEASPDRAAEPTLILQAHTDMVCAAAEGCVVDFRTEGLKLRVEDGFIRAEGTSLGADDGIAVAMMLALLGDASLSHPRLECVFTVDEEIGLVGANALDVSVLRGRRMINLDNEEEGVVLIGCAGGICLSCRLPLEFSQAQGAFYRLKIDGLLGGHSGTEIVSQRGNANKLLARTLAALQYSADFRIAAAEGGFQDNAIPRSAQALLVSDSGADALSAAVAAVAAELAEEYSVADPGLRVTLLPDGAGSIQALLPQEQDKLLFALNQTPDGVIRMSDRIAGLPETSLNLGIMRLDEGGLRLAFMLRSMINSADEALRERIVSFFDHIDGEATVTSRYDAWEYRRESPLRDMCVAVYEEAFSERPRVGSIHAGLECSVIAAKFPDMDCVSLGPTMEDVHTAEERLDIASAARTYEYIKKIIERKL